MQRIPIRDYWQLFRRYLAPQRSAAVLMASLLLASIALQLAGPQVTRSFINAVSLGAPESMLVRTALLFIALSMALQVVRVLALYWSERVAWTASNALRVDLTAHLLRLDASFHAERLPGELIERVDGDVGALAGFFSSFVVHLLGSFLLLMGVLVSLFLVSAQLGLAFTAFAVLAMAVLTWVRRFATPLVRETRERSAQFYGYLGEVMTSTEDIRSAGAVHYAFDRFYQHLRGWLPLVLRAEARGSLVWMTATVAFALGEALAYGLGGRLFQLQAISMGTVYMVIAYAALLAHPLESIRTQLQNLQRADASIARVRELLAIRSTLVDGPAVVPEGPLSVAFDGLSFQYDDDNLVLDDLSFRLEPGRVLGLLGHTGSGKSTMARLLFRQYDPTNGRVELGGVDLRNAHVQQLRSRIGLVTQEVQLFEASLRDNITFFDADIPDAHLVSVLETLGLKPWLDRLPLGLDTPLSAGSLSAGEAQLLAFARVFLYDPGLVILDEASSRLDPATEALLGRAVQGLLAGRTAIIIAHRLATVEQVDDILILEGGRILAHGPREEMAADLDSPFARLRQLGLEALLR